MVVVVGGGFAGRIAAGRIRRAGLPVTLVDPRPATIERTRLHQAAARETDVARPLDAYTRRIGADLVQARAAQVRGDHLVLDDGGALPFEQLVVATGSVVDRSLPGLEHALTLDDLEAAVRLRARAAELPDGAKLVVVGAGLTGIELATELAEAHPRLRVTLIGRLVDWSPRGERILREALDALGVEHLDVRATAVHARGLETDAGRLDADLIAWCGGMTASPWLRSSGLPVDRRGRLSVDAHLRVVGHERVVAAGDCAGTALPMACATAMPMGCHAAEVVARAARGEDPRPFRFAFAGRCVSLGRRRAVLQGVDGTVDRPTWAVGGRSVAVFKETVLWAVARAADWEAGSGVPLLGWPKGALPSPAEEAIA